MCNKVAANAVLCLDFILFYLFIFYFHNSVVNNLLNVYPFSIFVEIICPDLLVRLWRTGVHRYRGVLLHSALYGRESNCLSREQ